MTDAVSAGGSVVCPRCGTVRAGSRWCGGCGLNLDLAGELPPAEQSTAGPRQKDRLEQEAQQAEAARLVAERRREQSAREEADRERQARVVETARVAERERRERIARKDEERREEAQRRGHESREAKAADAKEQERRQQAAPEEADHRERGEREAEPESAREFVPARNQGATGPDRDSGAMVYMYRPLRWWEGPLGVIVLALLVAAIAGAVGFALGRDSVPASTIPVTALVRTTASSGISGAPTNETYEALRMVLP
jgi:hypothetical protein